MCSESSKYFTFWKHLPYYNKTSFLESRADTKPIVKYCQLIDSDTSTQGCGVNYYMLNTTAVTTTDNITEQYTFYQPG